MKRKCVAALFVISFLLISGCGAFNLPEGPKVLNVYSELPEDITNALVKDFEKRQNGKVKVEVKEITPQNLQEKLNFLKTSEADIWLGGSAEDYFLADDKNMLKPYQAKDLRNIPAGLRDKHGAWTGIFTTNLVFLSNRNSLISLGYDQPESWEDLLEANFQQELVISDPTMRQGGYRLLTTLWQLYGEKKFDDYMLLFKKQGIEYAVSDEAAIEDVRTGRKALTVVPLNLAMASAVRNNILVVSVASEGTSRKLSGAAIMSTAKQEAISRVFMDYLVSDNAKTILDTSDYYVWPLTDNPKNYTWGKQYNDVFLVHDDLRWCVLNSEEIIDKLKPVKK